MLTVAAPADDDRRGLLIETLLELPVRGVEERADALIVYLPDPGGDRREAVEGLARRLREAVGGEAVRVEGALRPAEEWAELWRTGLGTRRITDRLVVTPPWVPHEAAPGELVITIDPGMAFGTGEHASTRGCLRLLDPLVRKGERVADVGAGSGILAIACALLGASRVVALELDPWACRASRENAAANGVAGAVEVRAAAVGRDFLPGEPPFDGIVANIEPAILTELLAGLHAGLRPEGWLVMGGVPSAGAAGFATSVRGAGFRLEAIDEEDGWSSFAFTREAARARPVSG